MTYASDYITKYNLKFLLRTSALGLVLCAVPVGAQAVEWTGTTDTDWTTGTNWNGGNVPTGGDDITIDTTFNAPVISSVGAVNNYSYIGSASTGVLTIQNGGTLTSSNMASIGHSAGSIGTVTVTGAGSSWANSDALYVGTFGTGTLNIENGGTVSNTWSILGRFNAGVSTMIVTGAGSSWTNSSGVYFGYDGTCTLTIADSATVSATSVSLAYNASSTGTINIGAASGSAAVTSGILDVPTLAFRAGTASLVFNHLNTVTNPYLFAPNITGSGTIIAENGHTTLTGNLSNYTGSMSVLNSAVLNVGTTYGGTASVGTGGVLVANSTMTGAVAVNSGGTLKGSGTVGGVTVASGGIVAPGNSIGTLNVAGNISFAAGSFFDVEMNATTSDLTHATGTATITGGTVRLSKELPSDIITLNTNYTILTADGGVSGAFSAVTLDSLFLTPTFSSDANNIYVNVSRNAVSFLNAAYSFNETEMALALDKATSGAALSVVGMQSTFASAQVAMDRLSGEFHANIKSQILDEDAAFAHLINKQGGGYWATFYGDWQTQKSSTTHGFEADHNGFAFGRTEAVNDNTDLGFVFAYERADYELLTNQDDSATAKGKTYRAGIYASQKNGPWSFKVGSQYNYHDYDTDRHVVFSKYDQRHYSSYDAHSFMGYGEAAYTAFATTKLIVQPYAELIYGYGLITSFKETGDAGLRANSDGFHEGRSTIGVRMEQKLMFNKTPAKLSVDLGWVHRIGGANPTGNYSMDGTGEFKSQGTTRTRDELTFSTGLNFSLTDNAALDLTYMTNQSKAGDKHSARVGVAVKF